MLSACKCSFLTHSHFLIHVDTSLFTGSGGNCITVLKVLESLYCICLAPVIKHPILFWYMKGLYTHQQRVLQLYFYRYSPALNHLLLILFHVSVTITLGISIFISIFLTKQSKSQKFSKLTRFILFYTDLCLKTIYQYAN